MKTKCLILMPLFLVMVATIQSPAQQAEANQIEDHSATFEIIKTKAENGDAQAQSELADMYAAGDGVPKDDLEALKWHIKAADQGVAASEYKLGIALIAGVGGETNHQKGAAWLLKAAEQSYPDAELLLANLYARGDGLQQDNIEAYKWYTLYSGLTGEKTAAADQLAVAMPPEELFEAKRRIVERYRKLAKHGSIPAQCELGEIYRDGDDNVSKNFAEAVKWYRMAAEQGSELAARQLTSIYERSADGAEAIKWFREAAARSFVTTQFLTIREKAAKGDPEAQWKLGNIYGGGQANRDAGPGVPTDYNISAKWYLKAAEQGLAQAQLDLGMNLIDFGKNPAEGIRWIRKAAQQGSPVAQTQLAAYYYRGVGVQKNPVEGAKWFRKAAEQGFTEAQANLGESYFEGDGVPANYVEAYKWVSLASSQGFALLELPLSRIARVMTAEQIAEGQRLAQEFKPRKALQSGKLVSGNSILASNPSEVGTGFFITDDGYLISNNHVVEGAAKVRLVTSAGVISAKVVKVDEANDLALLKAEGAFLPLPITSSRAVRLGSTVTTVGFPDPGLQGFAPKLAKGEIAALSGAGDDARYFQISAPVQPGNSGGALVDAEGNVVGIVSAKLDAATALAASGALPENVNYAIKSSFLLSFLESVPGVEAKLSAPNTKDEKFEDVVKSAQDAAAMVLVY